MIPVTQYRYAIADVFTDRMFLGNPVAVVLNAFGLSTSQMQAIACEFNYTETTFVLPPRDPANTAWVRIFTPSREVPFAGHPNVGTAFILATEAANRGEATSDRFVFEEAAGLVPISVLRNGQAVVGAELASPEPLSRHTKVSAERAAACISLQASDVRTDAHSAQIVSVGLPFCPTHRRLARIALGTGRLSSRCPGTSLRAHPKLNAQTTGCKALDRLQYLVGMDSIIFGWPLNQRPPFAGGELVHHSALLAVRMLKAKLRRRANTPGLVRMRERSSPKVTSRL